MKNSLFYYATSELSQDAFICWLASFALNSSSKHKLRECAIKLLKLFVPELSSKDFTLTDIERQVALSKKNRLDILLTIQAQDTIYKVIVEDKTFTSEGENQLQRYISETTEKNHNCKVCGVYFKTAEYIYADNRVLLDDAIVKVTRKDILELITPYIACSEILNDYYLNLKALDDAYEETEQAYQSFNYDEALQYSYMQWRYFKDCFSEENDDGERVLPKDMSLTEAQESIQQGSSFGTPYTWYWFLEFSQGVPKDKIDTHGRYLGYRIDRDSKGTYLSLRMYCRYDKNSEREKDRQNSIFKFTRDFVTELIADSCPEVKENGFKIHFNKTSSMSYYECEIFRCYFNENIFDQKTNSAFVRMLYKIRNNLQVFV